MKGVNGYRDDVNLYDTYSPYEESNALYDRIEGLWMEIYNLLFPTTLVRKYVPYYYIIKNKKKNLRFFESFNNFQSMITGYHPHPKLDFHRVYDEIDRYAWTENVVLPKGLLPLTYLSIDDMKRILNDSNQVKNTEGEIIGRKTMQKDCNEVGIESVRWGNVSPGDEPYIKVGA